MSSNWLTNFDLFLRTKGSDDVQLWRLKKFESLSSASSQIMRLTPDDFEYISEVKDHQKLIENMFQWNITDYKNLINYISTRRLLVNGEGMVIAEVLKYDEDGNELPAVYYRSRDVVSLNTYIPSIHKRRKVKDIVVAPPAVDSNKTLQDKLDKERSDKQILAKRLAGLEAENKTLETDVTKLKADLATRTNEIAALETKNKTLETDVTKLKTDLATKMKEIADLEVENKTCDVTKLEADLATKTKEIADLEAENKTWESDVTKLKADLATKTNEIVDLEAENKTLEIDVTKLKAYLATRTNEIANLETENKTMETDMAKLKANLAARTNEIADLESKNKILDARTNEPWMKDFTAECWVGIEKLNKQVQPVDTIFTVLHKKGSFTKEDIGQTAKNITNISARYWVGIVIGGLAYTAIDVEDLFPNKDKARFYWSSFRSKGKTYAYR